MAQYFYLDFETNKASDFFLAGYSTGSGIQQVVLHPDLKPLAVSKVIDYLEPGQFIELLIRTLHENDATLVAYSTAEKESLLRYCATTNSCFGSKVRYLNLLKCAKRWIQKCHKAEFDALPPLRLGADSFTQVRMRRSLASVMRLTTFSAPADYAPGGTTKRINDIRKGLVAKHNIFEKLTAVQKAKATKLLKHNYFDVAALEVLLATIATECPGALLGGCEELVL